ncbi:MAG: methyltransferase domain-containing protein [Chloroflexota bacterium]
MAARTFTHSSAYLERRTLAKDHPLLARFLQPGMSVLDAGCGTGTMTVGMAETVGPHGFVLGTDINAGFLEKARATFRHQGNLRFEQRDLTDLGDIGPFDIATAARTIQWIARPDTCVREFARVTAPGGVVLVVDYNHAKVRWEPEPPPSMRTFHAAWLTWRAGNGLDNQIADHLADLFRAARLTDVTVHPHQEPVHREDPGFVETVRVWASMARLHGPEMVQKGLISEAECARAADECDAWVREECQFQQMYLLGVTGRKV